jgi:ankyrin repeat protein
MKVDGIYRRAIRYLMGCCLLSVSLVTSASEAFAQSGQRDCGKVPPGNWSVAFQPYSGPGHDTSPYKIIFMNMEACNGYLYLSDLQLNVPPARSFFVIEYSVFVYQAAQPNKILLQRQLYRMGPGDGDFADDGIWKTPPGKSWGAAFTTGDEPLMLPLMHDGGLEGDYRIELGITQISFGNKDVWMLQGRDETGDRNKALLEAAIKDDVASIQSLLAAGADVNAKDNGAMTPLMRAAHYGHTKSARLLISHGADINAQSTEGFTALILAAQYGYLETVRLLLKSNADLRAKNKDGMNALVSAGFGGRSEVWDVLKAAGAEVESSIQELICEAALGRTEVVEKMLGDGIDVNSKGPRANSALLLASLNGHLDTVKFLLAHSADVNGPDEYGWSPLRWALFAHHADIMKTLIKTGADINGKDGYGVTPLISAVMANDVEGAQVLVEADADLAVKDNVGKTAIDYAVEQANTGKVRPDDPMVMLLKSAAARKKI